jgi:hypothetical protein
MMRRNGRRNMAEGTSFARDTGPNQATGDRPRHFGPGRPKQTDYHFN